jgi:hypothetical protein
MAVVTSVEEMEKIVSRNRSLSWDGWTVLNTYPNPTAWRYTNGAYIKNKWHVQQRFEITETGWEIPNKLVR